MNRDSEHMPPHAHTLDRVVFLPSCCGNPSFVSGSFAMPMWRESVNTAATLDDQIADFMEMWTALEEWT